MVALGRLPCLLLVGLLLLSLAPPVSAQQGGDPLTELAQRAQAMMGEDQGAQEEAEAEENLLPGAHAEVRVTEAGAVELHVAELPLATVLQLLSLESRRNIIATPEVSGTVTASLYDVSFEDALEAILHANSAGFIKSGRFIYVYTQEQMAEMALAANPPVTKVFPLNYITPADAKIYVEGLLSEAGKMALPPDAESGIASSPDEAGGESNSQLGFVVITDRPAILEEVERVLKQVDVRPLQVLIEATILRARLTESNALGVDFSIVGGVDLEMLGATSNAVQNLALGALPQERFELFNAAASTDFNSNMSPGGLSLGIIKDHVAVFIRALEQVTDSVVLANPKILALNKQRGQVIVGRRDGYLTTTLTETQAVQSVEFLETGTQLIFRPYISRDGFVRLELHPEDSVGQVNAQGLPTEQTTEVTTNVVVHDGHTILIGGLFRDATSDARSQIPGLGNMPVIGQAFRSNKDSVEREEVIILLTVHIVKDHEAYAEASQEQQEDLERMRVGQRRGMMWHGKGRLAQAYYHRAVEDHAAGHPRRALWHVNLALHSQARLAPALRLRESLLGKRDWEDDGTSTRGFIYRVIQRDRGLVLPLYGRPAVLGLEDEPVIEDAEE